MIKIIIDESYTPRKRKGFFEFLTCFITLSLLNGRIRVDWSDGLSLNITTTRELNVTEVLLSSFILFTSVG